MLHVYFILKKLDTFLRVRIGILFSLSDLGFSIMATPIVCKGNSPTNQTPNTINLTYLKFNLTGYKMK